MCFDTKNKKKEVSMRKLALSDEILLTVEKPARYIGNEVNMVKKNPADVDVRFCMCFPDAVSYTHLTLPTICSV